jgi:DNA-binding protein H-NS
VKLGNFCIIISPGVWAPPPAPLIRQIEIASTPITIGVTKNDHRSFQTQVRHKQQLGDARKQVVQYAKSLGYTIDELFGTGKGEKAKVKFHNPANPDQTWSGRGKRPNWFKEALASGKSKEDLAL